MTAAEFDRDVALIVRVGTRVCAVPLPQVVETMRPLPVESVRQAPPFVRGLSLIRGVPVPVVDLRGLLAEGDGNESTRFVTVRVGDRQVALAVDAVLGIRELNGWTTHEPPPLLGEASADCVQAIGTLDAELLVVLRTTRILPADAWQMLSGPEPIP